MALFKTNYSEVEETDYSPLPTAEYECVIARVGEKATPNGKESLNIGLVVRNDLKQVPELAEQNGKYADRWVFVDEWKRDIDGRYIYKMDNFMHYLNAVGVPEGTEIRDMDHLFELLRNKPVRVYVKEETNTYKGETRQINTVAPWGFKATKYPNLNHEFKKRDGDGNTSSGESNPWAEKDGPVDISDEDLPF